MSRISGSSKGLSLGLELETRGLSILYTVGFTQLRVKDLGYRL